MEDIKNTNLPEQAGCSDLTFLLEIVFDKSNVNNFFETCILHLEQYGPPDYHELIEQNKSYMKIVHGATSQQSFLKELFRLYCSSCDALTKFSSWYCFLRGMADCKLGIKYNLDETDEETLLQISAMEETVEYVQYTDSLAKTMTCINEILPSEFRDTFDRLDETKCNIRYMYWNMMYILGFRTYGDARNRLDEEYLVDFEYLYELYSRMGLQQDIFDEPFGG